jgi:UbiD family decarboxylase
VRRRYPAVLQTAPVTGVPVPVPAEMVFEGEVYPDREVTLPEGPFGESTGHYATEKCPAPVMQVTAMHRRNDPILLGSPPMKSPRFHFGLPLRAAAAWSDLGRCGVVDVVDA